jgi:hypothetical protein
MATDTDAPTSVSIRARSVVSRLITSPVRTR